jgi:hypothetical protein
MDNRRLSIYGRRKDEWPKLAQWSIFFFLRAAFFSFFLTGGGRMSGLSSRSGPYSQKELAIVTLHGKYAEALTFENLFQGLLEQTLL